MTLSIVTRELGYSASINKCRLGELICKIDLFEDECQPGHNRNLSFQLFHLVSFRAVFISVVSYSLFLGSAVFSGLCLYSFYKHCDPLTAGKVYTLDQVFGVLCHNPIPLKVLVDLPVVL